MKTVFLQPAFILQYQKYRETSLLMDVFTQDFGTLAVLAKGVRTPKSKTAALLQPFVPLHISYLGNTGLSILTDAQTRPPAFALQGLALYCGFYANELVGRFLHKHDPHPEIFAAYRDCLAALAGNTNIEAALRRFELELIQHVGYGFDWACDSHNQAIEPQKNYLYQPEQGLVASAQGWISGLTLQAIAVRQFTTPQALTEAKRLTRAVIDSHLQGRPLKSRAVIAQIIKIQRSNNPLLYSEIKQD
jgi:DNA repair protein RecO (recombination protein O)